MTYLDGFCPTTDIKSLLDANPPLHITPTSQNITGVDVQQMWKGADVPTKELLKRFQDSLRSNVDVNAFKLPIVASQSPSLKNDTRGIRKRKHQNRENTTEHEKGEETSMFTKFKLVAKSSKETNNTNIIGDSNRGDQRTTFGMVRNCGDAKSVYSDVAQSVDCMEVPVGASAMDCVTLYDSKKKKFTRMYIDMPTNAYEGMKLLNSRPASNFKQVMLDGEGFKVGGSIREQHACRLFVHRKMCTNVLCNVLGCGLDPAYKVFKDAASDDMKSAYERYWNMTRKAALEMHGNTLKARAEKSCF